MKKKIYICDCCHKQMDDPYTEKMKEFYYGFKITIASEIKAPKIKHKKKIHLCHRCFLGLSTIAEREAKNDVES